MYLESPPSSLLQFSVVYRVKAQLHRLTSAIVVHDGIFQPDGEDRVCSDLSWEKTEMLSCHETLKSAVVTSE